MKKIKKIFFSIFWPPAPVSPSPSGGCSTGQGSKFQNRLDGATSMVLSYSTVPHMPLHPPPSGLHDGCYSFRGGLSFNYAAVCSTLDSLLVFTLDGLSELGSSLKEIFLVAPFEKSPKLIIFQQILHSEFTGLIENIFR